MLGERREDNAHVLKLVQDAVLHDCNRSLDDILAHVKMTEPQYMKALQHSTSNPTIILQRQPWETTINNYNAELLNIWSANLDVQYVTNAYCMCNVYFVLCQQRRKTNGRASKISFEGMSER